MLGLGKEINKTYNNNDTITSKEIKFLKDNYQNMKLDYLNNNNYNLDINLKTSDSNLAGKLYNKNITIEKLNILDKDKFGIKLSSIINIKNINQANKDNIIDMLLTRLSSSNNRKPYHISGYLSLNDHRVFTKFSSFYIDRFNFINLGGGLKKYLKDLYIKTNNEYLQSINTNSKDKNNLLLQYNINSNNLYSNSIINNKKLAIVTKEYIKLFEKNAIDKIGKDNPILKRLIKLDSGIVKRTESVIKKIAPGSKENIINKIIPKEGKKILNQVFPIFGN
ncbi:MAG TPA: hypothetical protein QKA14_00850 [Candidatus Megaira endosymbiont of Hartmannula sinica]|nr:hypothetical protein [Candidatus Megaera endosymbiont of Hartmannula sinica]